MPFRDLGFNFTYYYFINYLFATAKVQRLLPDSKNLGEIFPELLRQGIIDATKLAQGAKSCRFLKLARRP